MAIFFAIFIQVCCLVVLVTINGSRGDEGVESWTGESESWSGNNNFGLQHLPQQPISVQDDMETASAQRPLVVIPGSVRQTSKDQRSQSTIFYPKKEHEQRIRQLPKQSEQHHGHHNTQHITPHHGPKLVTKWGGHSPEHVHRSKIDQEEDNEHQSNEPIYYAYEYKVHDPLTGDVKGHKELRDGDRVKGYYMLHDADGSMREVHYTADHEVGFTAVVSKTDDVAPPHKPSSSSTFEHNSSPKSVIHKGTNNNKFQSQSSSFQHGNVKSKKPQVFHNSHPKDEPHRPHFEFPHDFHNHGKHTHSEVHIESNDEAKNVEHFRPTPSYEDAYTNFAKEQPMPVINEDHQSYSHDDDQEDDDHEGKDDFFFNNDDFDSFDSKSSFLSEHSSKKSTSPIHQPHNFRPFQENIPFRRPRMHESSPKRKAKSYSSFNSEIKPTYETYESDHDRDESRSSFSVVPATELILRTESNAKFIPFPVATDSVFNTEPSESALRPQLQLDQYVDDKAINQLKRMPFTGPFNNNQHSKQASERSNDFEESSFQFQRPRSIKPKPESYKGIHSNRAQYNLKLPPFNSMEGGFQPIVNPYENGYWKPERYNDPPHPKRNAFKHSTSLSPDNSRFRSFKNQSYSDFSGNHALKTRDFPQQPYKKGIVENADPGRRPNRYLYSKWGNSDYKSDYFDNSNSGLYKSDYFTEPKGYDKGMHLVPKREVFKSKHQKAGMGFHAHKGQMRLTNKKPKITSIYDVMAYGGTDWPKKVRSSHYDKKKPRKVMKGFSNRRYNDAKKKRSVLPFEGYFPDRMTNDQWTQRTNNHDFDYEYVNSY